MTQSSRALDYHARERLRRWHCRKHGVDSRGPLLFPDQHLHDELGLVKLCLRTKGFSWAKA
ncbi:MAG: hypothetical protein HS101_07985 [Planctomycetia bacterium]|nr:hypothetical protein [Planctomycetia bacterium]